MAGAGVSFAYVKASEGVRNRDPRFAPNWSAMKDAGLLRGAYHFFRPAKSVAAQVENFCGCVGALGPGDLPPALDLEETSAENDEWKTVPKAERVHVALDWLTQVEARLGRRPIVYTRKGFVSRMLGKAGALTNYVLWVAHYTAAAKPAVPDGWPGWTLWQHSDKGRVAGVKTKVDLDRFAGTPAELRALAGIAAAEAAATGQG